MRRGRRLAPFAPALAATLVAGLAVRPARAAEGDVVLRADEQLFDVLAAINVAGYNDGIGINSGDDTRQGARDVLAKENIPVLPRLKAFYAAHKAGLDPGEDLGQYVSLALLLGPPPDFRFTISPQDLPPDAHSVMDMVPLLKEFYRQADLTDLWARAEIHYRERIERYSAPVRRRIELTDAYLRFATGAYLGRTYVIDVDLLGAPEQVQGRVYRSDYYLVVTPSAHLRLHEIRYQYLHFLLDPLAVKYAADVDKASGLLAIARKAPGLNNDFRNDFSLLMTECLVQAVELRMDKTPPAEAQKKAWQLAETGLILTPYFYNALEDFEKQDSSMSVYYKQMVDGIDPAKQGPRLASLKFSAPAQAPLIPAPARSEKDRMLDQADNDIYQGNYEQAKIVYEEILQRFDPKCGQAFYGIAVVDSFLRKPDLAREYFNKTIQTARDTRLVTWSHIYLGRIDDLSGDRKAAVAQYRAASITAAAYPEALSAVQQGLQMPYGSR